MRVWPRSIRARDTLIAMAISAGVLALIATGVDMLIRNAVIEHLLHENQLPVRRVSAAVRHDSVPEPIPEGPSGVRIQILDAQRRVINATRSAAGRPSLGVGVDRDDRSIYVRRVTHGHTGAIRGSTAMRPSSGGVVTGLASDVDGGLGQRPATSQPTATHAASGAVVAFPISTRSSLRPEGVNRRTNMLLNPASLPIPYTV